MGRRCGGYEIRRTQARLAIMRLLVSGESRIHHAARRAAPMGTSVRP